MLMVRATVEMAVWSGCVVLVVPSYRGRLLENRQSESLPNHFCVRFDSPLLPFLLACNSDIMGRGRFKKKVLRRTSGLQFGQEEDAVRCE
jgi:hypothetical protein